MLSFSLFLVFPGFLFRSSNTTQFELTLDITEKFPVYHLESRQMFKGNFHKCRNKKFYFDINIEIKNFILRF